jgi:hypothetical protein
VTAVAITTATLIPFSSAMEISRRTARQVLLEVSWFVASARTVTASVCVPALPPIPATIGISTARVTSWAITLSKRQITNEATEAVTRFAISQRTRAR